MKSGKELMQATRPFVAEDLRRSWTSLFTCVAIVLALMVAIAMTPIWWVQLGLAVVLGLTQIRLFIFYHDYLHGAILRRSRAAEWVMAVIGAFMLSVRSVWRETHNYHHKNNAKLIGSSIGSFPLVTTRMWRFMSPQQQLAYRVARHPIFIFGGYLTVFLLGMSFLPFKRDPKKHWEGPFAVVLHIASLVGVGLTFGWWAGFCIVVLPKIIAFGIGSYLFYAQHNFPSIKLRERRQWDYNFAALNSSSMFEMSGLMHWFTGNIGFHHIHHLNHRIPFYNLPKAMEALPELQVPGRTSWKPSDVAACLRCKLWDPKEQRMVGFRDVERASDVPLAAGAEA